MNLSEYELPQEWGQSDTMVKRRGTTDAVGGGRLAGALSGAIAGAGAGYRYGGLSGAGAGGAGGGILGALSGGAAMNALYPASEHEPEYAEAERKAAIDRWVAESMARSATRKEVAGINGFANTAGEARDIDKHVAMKQWIDANPGMAQTTAGMAGAANSLLLGLPGRTYDGILSGNTMSQLRTSYPNTYRAGTAAGVAPWFAIAPQVATAASLNAVNDDPIVEPIRNALWDWLK